MTEQTLVGIFSAAVSVLAFIVSCRSYFLARAAFRLTKTEFGERHEEIKAYLIEGFSWHSSATDRFVLFAASFINSANAPNSLARIELKIDVYDADRNLTHALLEPIGLESTHVIPWKQLEPLKSPLNLPARTTTSGWVAFKIPELFIKCRTIDRYELAGISSTGSRVSVECFLLRKVTNGHDEG